MKPIASLLLALCCVATSFAQTSLKYEGADELPAVKIDGESVKIHTQGLFVTDESYLVTGRLETKPKRALLLRFIPEAQGSYEVADITPKEVDGKTLDHPGGFDVDDDGLYWIPLSTSNRDGPSIICCYELSDKLPLKELKLATSFEVDDHIGAICCVGEKLIGANWDTKCVYIWNRKGELQRKIDRNQLLSDSPQWQIAVQDWKRFGDESDTIILGGIDKSNLLRKATVQLIDTKAWKIVRTYTLDSRDDVKRPLTNEGLCVHGDEIYLLPEDIGAGAKVLRYSFAAKSQ